MAEPRARLRTLGTQQFPSRDLSDHLIAFGDDLHPLQDTVRTLDEIIVDYIIETCHEAALHASYSRRQKIKVDDFRFALRKDPAKLGRMSEMTSLEKEFAEQRKAFKADDDSLQKAVAAAKAEEEDGPKAKRQKTAKSVKDGKESKLKENAADDLADDEG